MTLAPPSLNIIHTVLLSLVAGTPLLFAVFCCTPLSGKTTQRFLPLAAVPALFTALTAPLNVIVAVPWFFMGSQMGIDETGRVFLFLAAFIWFLASFSIRSMLKNDRNQTRFLVFYLVAMSGNFGLILARGMLGYYLFFAVMSFAAYGLVVHKRSDEAAKAGRIYLTLVMIGEVALFTALIILVHNIGSIALQDIAGVSYHPLTLALLFIGFGVKIGALPLHGWMVPAYQATPIPAAAVLAGSMVNAGILGWMRFLPLGQTSCPEGAVLFVIAGAIAAVYGVIIGLKHKQAGAVLGCSSISQMGLITVIFGLGILDHDAGLQAAPVLILYVVHHSLMKSSLFFGYDLAERQGRTLSYLQIGAILLPALALAGLPFTSGAIAKTAFKDLAITLGEPWYSLSTFFLPITAMGTTLLMLHFIFVLKRNKGNKNPAEAETKTVFTVSFIAAAITLWIWPAGKIYISHSLSGIQILHASWPVAFGSLLYFIWHRISSNKIKLDNTFDKQTFFDMTLSTAARIFQEKEWQRPPQGRLDIYLNRLIPPLRRSEKIMGRWKVVGLSYLVLCIYLLFLLL